MRTSLTEIKNIEEYLLQNGSQDNKLLMEARLLLDKELRENVQAQREAYTLINWYGRQQTRKAIAAADRQFFGEEKHRNFRERILRLFHKF